MKRGVKEVSINMNKLLKLKPLVDDNVLEINDVCKILGISRYLYSKWSKKVDEMNGVETK